MTEDRSLTDPEIEERNRKEMSPSASPHRSSDFEADSASQQNSEFVKSWNELCEGLPKVSILASSMRKKLALRIAEGMTLERFRQGVDICAKSTFLCGKNDRAWRATFDWLIKNDTNLDKVCNGNYGGDINPASQQSQQTCYADPHTLYSGPEYQNARGGA